MRDTRKRLQTLCDDLRTLCERWRSQTQRLLVSSWTRGPQPYKTGTLLRSIRAKILTLKIRQCPYMRGPRYRPQNTVVILVVGTSKTVPLINPKPSALNWETPPYWQKTGEARLSLRISVILMPAKLCI